MSDTTSGMVGSDVGGNEPPRPSDRVRALDHGPQLQHLEFAAAEADTALAVDDGAGAPGLDRDRGDQQQRREDHQGHRGDGEVEGSGHG